MTKRIICIALLIISPICILFALYTRYDKVNSRLNGFNRNFIKVNLDSTLQFKLDKNIFSISGITPNHIYLERNAGEILTITHNFSHSKTIRLPLIMDKKTHSHYETVVDTSGIYFFAGNKPLLLFSDFTTSQLVVDSSRIPVFTRAIYLDRNSYIIRGLEGNKPNQRFYKVKIDQRTSVQPDNYIIPESKDAGMATDGILQYDHYNNLITYLFYYENSILCMDTNLSLSHRIPLISKRLDSNVAIRDFANSSQKALLTNVKPNVPINRKSTIHEGKMFVISNLKADNENSSEFAQNSVVDIYNIQKGSYVGSFYIPLHGTKILDFKISRNDLFVLFKGEMFRYKLQF